ncbi:MAG TPA: sigma-70 family RNA polymerase sigma factor [Vicinamibacteria bacterium]|nr:sigma-70 family RNA polymerase sigma factor [Vicinamibacteria bacterium]
MPDTASRAHLEATFLSALPVIDTAVAHVLKRHRLGAAEREDFAAEVRLAIIRYDYRILARFQGQSSLRTYLVVVVKRLFIDYRRRLWGTWRPSAAARHMGPVASRLEMLLYRDGRTLEEAVSHLQAGCEAPSRDEICAIAARLPLRLARSTQVRQKLLDVPTADLAGPESALECDATAARTQEVVTQVMQSLPAEDRLILRLRFEDDVPAVDIARMLQLDQKRLYRRIERLLATFRCSLQAHGIDWPDLRSMIERGRCHLRLAPPDPAQGVPSSPSSSRSASRCA